MATIHLCLDTNGIPLDCTTLESLPTALDHGVSVVWIDVDAGEDAEIQRLQRIFGLHALAVEDARDNHQRAKYRLYDDMLFVQFYGLELSDDAIQPQEIAIFLGECYVITVRHSDKPTLAHIHQRWRDRETNALSSRLAKGNSHTSIKWITPMHLLYIMIDDLVDGYFPAVEWLGDRVSDLEDTVLDDDGRTHQVEIHHLRRQVFQVRRLLAPEQEVLNMLLRRDVPMMDDALIPYFADIHDHVLRVQDWTESYREQLSTIADIQVSMQSQRLDRTVRTLTVWTIVLMVCGLIAGIYGMNFQRMPELDWRFGYPLALSVMVGCSIVLGFYFRRRDWW